MGCEVGEARSLLQAALKTLEQGLSRGARPAIRISRAISDLKARMHLVQDQDKTQVGSCCPPRLCATSICTRLYIPAVAFRCACMHARRRMQQRRRAPRCGPLGARPVRPRRRRWPAPWIHRLRPRTPAQGPTPLPQRRCRLSLPPAASLRLRTLGLLTSLMTMCAVCGLMTPLLHACAGSSGRGGRARAGTKG